MIQRFGPVAGGRVPTSSVFGMVLGSKGIVTPSNADIAWWGDSRTENGFQTSVSATTGYGTKTTINGAMSYIGPASGHKLRLARNANFAIFGSTTIEGAAIPRQSAAGTVTVGQWWRGSATDTVPSGSDNKGVDYAINHEAGIFVYLDGTNDGATNWVSASRIATLSVVQTLAAASKIVVVLNELPRGIKPDGTLGNNLTLSDAAAFKAYSVWLAGLDYASGQPQSQPNVIAVDSWSIGIDPSSGAQYYNLPGMLYDGLHPTQYYCNLIAQAITARLQAVFPSWYAALPSLITIPTTNGLSTPTASAPFLNPNPIMTAGTGGTVTGNWSGTAPSASGVCQGWTLTGGASGYNLTCVASNTGITDPQGGNAQRLVISGSLGASTTSYITMSQNSTASLISSGMMTLASKLRAMLRFRVQPGSVGLSAVSIQGALITTSTPQNMITTTPVIGYFASYYNQNGLDVFAGSQWMDFMSSLDDLADPNLAINNGNPTGVSAIQVVITFYFTNYAATAQSVGATIDVSRAGYFVDSLTANSSPAQPTITSVTPGSGQCSIAWTDGATGGSAITKHGLYRGTASNAETFVTWITGSSPYVDTGLAHGQTYYYRLSAYNAGGESNIRSNEVSATTT